jgi:carboxyl-terminal processing protease
VVDEGERHEADLRNILTNDLENGEAAPAEEDAGATEGEAAEPIADGGRSDVGLEDYQLARALDLLHGIALYRSQLAVN